MRPADVTSKLTRAAAFLPVAVAACGDTSGPIRSITFAPCGPTPSFFAFQGSGGGWTQVASQGGSFAFRLPQERMSIIYTVPAQTDGSSSAHMYSMTTDEFLQFATQPCPSQAGSKTINGTFSNLPAEHALVVTMGTAAATVDPNANAFSIVNVADGALDVMASTQKAAPNGGQIADAVVIRRALSVADGASLVGFDLGGSEPTVVSNGTITVSGLTPEDVATVSETYYTNTRTRHSLLSGAAVNGTTPNVGLSDALSVAGDFYIHELAVLSNERRRAMVRYDDAPGNRTLAVGPPLSAPTFTKLSATPFGRVSVSLPAQSEYASFVFARVATGSGTATLHQVDMIVTAGYLGAAPTTWTLAVPDLTQVPGYPSQLTLGFPGTLTWQVSAHRGPIAGFFGGDGIESGTVFTSASRTGSTQIP